MRMALLKMLSQRQFGLAGVDWSAVFLRPSTVDVKTLPSVLQGNRIWIFWYPNR